MKPFVPSPGSTASPYPPTGTNQDLYPDRSSRIPMPGAITAPGFLSTDDKNSHSMRRPPPPGFRPPQGPPKSIYTVFNQQAERELYHHHEVTLSRN
ncbi:uncharacterized protein LOC144118999 isoform X3 [Amblyomma americanum]